MRELPCLMNGEGVRATMAGTKTQTRRPLRPQPKHDARYTAQPQRLVYTARSGWEGVMWDPWQLGHPRPGYEHVAKLNPLGVPGDLLYVRETWAAPFLEEYVPPSEMATCEHIVYRATDTVGYSRWRPSIYMPKWATRLWLVNTGVRVERIQDISYDDILAEGLGEPPFVDEHEAHIAFAELWDSIYAKRGLGWDSNCWVFVTSYEVTER